MFKLKLENENNNIVDLNDYKRFLIMSYSGFNPPSATIFTSKSANMKGSKYNGSTLDERTIVISIKILGDIVENRNYLYDWIDSEQYVKIYYQNDVKNVFCEGHIEEAEIDMCNDNQVINLVILCEDPYLKDLKEIKADLSKILNQFTFPFAIDKNGIPFSTLKENNVINIFNSGAETGVLFFITCNGTVENLMIYDAKNTAKRFLIKTTLLKNWVVLIDTASSPKTCIANLPDGTSINLLKFVGNNPTWLTLKKGNNVLGFSADTGENNVNINISTFKKYLGV